LFYFVVRNVDNMFAFRYSLRVLQTAFHPYCSPNIKQEQNAICSICSE